MPKPQEGEKQSDFLVRCIPQIINEGKERDQAIAICASLWEQNQKNN